MFDNINRFEVIDKTGRSYTNYNCKIEAFLQDEGRTLKIFVEPRKMDSILDKDIEEIVRKMNG